MLYQNYVNLTDFIKYAKRLHQVETGETDLSENIEDIYEWEYKYYKIINNPSIPEARKENMVSSISKKILPITNNILDNLLDVFSSWLDNHALLDPHTWATTRIKEIEDIGDPYEILVSALSEHERYAYNSMDIVDALKDIYDSNSNAFSYLVDDLRSDNIAMIEADKDYIEESEYVESLNMAETEDEESIFYNLLDSMGDPESVMKMTYNYLSDYAWEQLIIKFYEENVFPVWYDHWSAEGIDETRDNIEELYGEMVLIREADNLPKKFVVINKALNACHQTGSMLDYVSNIDSSISTSLLTELSNKDTTIWDKDLLQGL